VAEVRPIDCGPCCRPCPRPDARRRMG
jgi:hypothetical protein